MKKWIILALLVSLLPSAATAAPVTLQKGDHICLVGNTLAEQMQHHGWLETLIYSRLADHDLSFRNLGFSADELTIRLRSADFGTPDEWLTRCRADVIFAFFGYNESFGGEKGLDKFKQDLDAFIKHTMKQQYNGKSAPRLVLFSPIAHENLKDENLPDGQANNERLKLYTEAMHQVARANQVGFVDLFTPSLELYRTSNKPLTLNGIHLTEYGDQMLAPVIEQALFPDGPMLKRDAVALDKIHTAVLDKNFYWFNRYRTTDGYSIYGKRADIKFEGVRVDPDGKTTKVPIQTNREVMQREMEVLDSMTANRDKQIWNVARGGQVQPVDDSNHPPFIPVVTNKPGPLPGGQHVFLGGEEAIEKMTVHKGMKVNLFASEEKFPELINPVQMAFDTKGRLWVATWPTYPHWKPKTEEMNDRLLILEDTDGDGKADKCTTFADHLHNPTGFEFWGGGVFVAMAPDLLFLQDTDGDDKADIRTPVLHGLDSADTHHTSNSFSFDPGGALYFQEGTFHHTQIETPWGAPRRVANGAVFRFEPRAKKIDVYVSFGFANPHGHAFDHWGQDIVVDGTGAVPYHAALFSGHVDYPVKHGRPPSVYNQRTRPCPGIEYLSSKHFPAEFRGNLLVGNVIGFQGILQYKVHDEGASFGATELEPILSSSDPNFRPADMEVAPDGALYFTDWQNPIIGHLQHNLRDPSRDKIHGRVYRVTYEGRPLVKPAPLTSLSVDKLLDQLKEPDDRIRYRARMELSARPTTEVIKATNAWIADLDKNDAEHEHQMMEALWVHQHHNIVDTSLLERMLTSPDFHARAAATRVLCYWRDRVSNSLELVKKQAADSHPRVRLEAIRAASFFTVAEAVEIPLIAADYPSDMYLDFQRAETMKTLDPYLKGALADGRRPAFTSEAGARFFLKSLSTEQLLKEDRTRVVFLEMLYRPGLQDEVRREAVRGLAKLDNKPELRVVMDAIKFMDEKQANADVSVVFDLVRQLTSRGTSELTTARAELEQLAVSAKQPVFRQIGFVSLINVDGSIDQAWSLATRNVKSLLDFVNAMPLISDGSVRASLYDKIEPLLQGLPAPLNTAETKGTNGRYVRVELPGKGTLTLAEVEVYSGGDNVARRGRAIQKNTSNSGDAKKAIDGNKDGSFAKGGQSHTEENTGKPYWELDLGEQRPIDQIVIYNRTDDKLGERLNDYTLLVLDEDRGEVFKQEKLPAPKVNATFDLSGGGSSSLVRRAAMNALTYVRGQELKTFQTLVPYVRDNVDRFAAVRALQRIPRANWPKDDATPLLTVLKDYVRKTPAADRTSPAVLDVLEFADALTGLLPPLEAKKNRAELSELGVRVIRIGTLFERMSYDKDIVVVKAGKPVEFLLENSDLMPHNFVITEPGSLEEIGLLAEASAQQPAFAARYFVPQSKKVLLSSTLLQPRETQKLSFVAPKKPGIYPYVCTYPGHWRRMYGALYVVEDLDEYLENPEAYLTLHPIEAKDALLKDRRPRTEWKFDDLASGIEEMTREHGRSFGNGKQLFQVANCIACHKLNGVGNEFGPDLAKLDPKFQTTDIMKEILDPSLKINEKFQTYIFQLSSGKTVTGLIISETPDTLKIIENPLAKSPPIDIKKSEIDERLKSPVSMMPKGLLDKLTRDEILDLLAYINARGDKNHELYQPGHKHGH
jgi:putative heme-binding domain-containing protein